MALIYDITKVKNWQSICYRLVDNKELQSEKEWEKNNQRKISVIELPRFEEDGNVYEMKPKTMNLQFLMALNIGIGEITQSNFKQVYARILFQETLIGCNITDSPTTLEDVKNHIGMKVNASLRQPAQFTRSVIKSWKQKNKLEL
jgi:hypothetical protein